MSDTRENLIGTFAVCACGKRLTSVQLNDKRKVLICKNSFCRYVQRLVADDDSLQFAMGKTFRKNKKKTISELIDEITRHI